MLKIQTNQPDDCFLCGVWVCLLIGYHDGEHVKSFNYFSFEQKDLKTIGNFENR